MSDNKEQCQPVAYCAPDKNGLPNFGKGWCFSKLKNEQATMPLYAAAQPVVLSDEDKLFQIIRSFGYTTKGQTDEIVAAILAAKEQE